MNDEQIESWIHRLSATQAQICDLLASYVDIQDFLLGPEKWTFACLAAHLAAAEKECFQDRIERIATGSNPSLDYYSDTGRDFGAPKLHECLQEWRSTRRDILNQLRKLPKAAWTLTGRHATQGTITIADILESMLAHDREHWEELEQASLRIENSGCEPLVG